VAFSNGVKRLLLSQIPLSHPFSKGGIFPLLFGKEGGGEIHIEHVQIILDD
jgi:hypothetical protein